MTTKLQTTSNDYERDKEVELITNKMVKIIHELEIIQSQLRELREKRNEL